MEHLMKISLTALATGIFGTTLGGIAALFFDKQSPKILSFILEFSAGLMMSVVCFDLLPNAFELSSFYIVILGVIAGILFSMFVQEKLKYSKKSPLRGKSGLLTTGIIMAVGVAVHNFPEGLAIGSGFEASIGLGVSLTIVILIHDIPEGIAMALPLKKGGVSAFKAVGSTVLAGIPMGIGAFIGAALGYISRDIIALSLAYAGGAMLYISIGDLIPESKNIYNGRLSAVGNVLGILMGLTISVLFD